MTKSSASFALQQPTGGLTNTGKSIFILTDYSRSLLSADESLRGSQSTEEENFSERSWCLSNSSNMEDSTSYTGNMWQIIFSDSVFPSFFCVLGISRWGFFFELKSQLVVSYHLLPLNHLYQCHKQPFLTVTDSGWL